MPSGNRLRGDSIIFDPTSFCDGGIHEESALMHTTKQELSADSVLSQQGPLLASSSAQPGPAPKTIKPTSSGRRPKPSFKIAAASAEPVRPVVGQGSAPSAQVKQTARGAKLSHSPIKYTKTTSKGGASTRTVSASRPFPQALTENTIHMPHGSDAAAAAAAGLPEPADASQGDGFSLSHTACPMDLLNKGGRIGIYLPE